jgi:predicted nucleic acid-binding Zn finger protein
MHDRLHLKFAQCLDAVKYPFVRVFVNRSRGELRLADTYCRCHNKHRLRAKSVCLLLVGRKIGKTKDKLRKCRGEDSASEEVTAEEEG